MMVDVLDKKNKKAEEMELPDRIFKAKWNPDLVNQVLAAQLANRRETLAHAKGRGEVRGGGKKPWRQKGTGRARHGSIRSPIWRGGGVSFGPSKERIFAKKINKKMRRLAIFSVLSRKFKDNECRVFAEFGTQDFKTKNLLKFLKDISILRQGALLIPSSDKKAIRKAARNIQKVDAIAPHSLNIYDLLKHKNIILEKGAVREIESHFK